MQMPADVDGITADLKVPGKRPRVFVNTDRPERRRRFTLAHEYGHIRIPWHMGTIVDVADQEEGDSGNTGYWRMEEEANRFASELLLPRIWLRELCETASAAAVHRAASERAEVSRAATAIALVEAAPPGWLYARIVDGEVRATRKSAGTITDKIPWGMRVTDVELPPGAVKTALSDYDCTHVWWQVEEEQPVPSRSTEREWRDLLDELLSVSGLQRDDQKQLAKRINGVLSAANSGLLTAEARTPQRLYAALITRFRQADLGAAFEAVKEHPLLQEFILARMQVFLSK